MKKLYILLFICVSNNSFSQIKDEDINNNEELYWEIHSNPSFDNVFTNHFKQFLSPSLIASADLSKRKKEIILQFNLDKKNNIINVRTNSKNKLLNNSIINAFKLFSEEDLNLPVKSELHNYALQIICKENNQPILKCSSIILYTIPAIFKECESSIKNHATLMKCNNSKVQTFILNNFDHTLGKRSGLYGIVSIFAVFTIDKDTKGFTKIKVKAPNEALEFETIRVLSIFPEVAKSAYLLDEPVNIKFSLPLKMVIQ